MQLSGIPPLYDPPITQSRGKKKPRQTNEEKSSGAQCKVAQLWKEVVDAYLHNAQ